MANYKAVSSGVWSALARWQDDSSGSYVASTVLPGAADVVYANNFTVTLDIDVVVSQLRTTSATNVNAGGLFDFGAANNVTANITAGTSVCVRNNTANNKIITGNCTGGTSSSSFGVNNSANGTITINGNVTGSTGSISCGSINNSTGTLIINGTATGGGGSFSFGVENAGSGTVTVNGVAIGGSGADVPGARNNSTGLLTVTTCQGSTSNPGVLGNNIGGTTVISNLVWPSNGRIPVQGFARFSNAGPNTATVLLQNGSTQLLTDNSTVNYPVQADVRNLVQYGPGNIYTGTLVPDITPQDIFTAIANSSDPIAVRLRNVATVQTTGDQIAAAL